MNKQKIVEKSRSYAATLAAGEVSSLRIKEDEKTVIRVYEDGKIGVAGRIGEGDDEALEAQAAAALVQDIPYPDAMCGGEKRHIDLVKDIIPEDELLNTVRHLASRLKERFPDFIFSDKFAIEEEAVSYSDSADTDLSYADKAVLVGLSIKSAGSANIMDLGYYARKRHYDEDAVVEDIAKLLDVYSNKLPLPEEKLPVIMDMSFVQHALSHVVAEMYASGASLFSGKLGQKLFDECVNILIDRTPGKNELSPFFDSEGVTLEGDKFYFVKDGVFCGLATYRRSAAMLNLPLSGCGYADFDAVPQCGNFRGIELDTKGKKLSEVFSGKAIYVSVTSGGDMIPDGKFATPVMLAYLYDNGKLVGTLPEFGVSGNIFDLLGKDLIAIAKNDVYGYMDEDVVVANFNIDKK